MRRELHVEAECYCRPLVAASAGTFVVGMTGMLAYLATTLRRQRQESAPLREEARILAAAGLMRENPGISDLTPKERKVVRAITEKPTTREIADQMQVSPPTIETHRRNICLKLGLAGSHPLQISPCEIGNVLSRTAPLHGATWHSVIRRWWLPGWITH